LPKNAHRGAGLSRRDVLIGAATTALVAASPPLLAAGSKISRATAAATLDSMPAGRYMAAATALSDGRILVTGGYASPPQPGFLVVPSSSGYILNPGSGAWTVVASMNLGRARHAAVALPDGRVAVIGGISGSQPTSSVEIFDPSSNTWSYSAPLAQARFDHSAVASAGSVYVIGGAGESMICSVELLSVNSSNSINY
jgi:hypothetical protein